MMKASVRGGSRLPRFLHTSLWLWSMSFGLEGSSNTYAIEGRPLQAIQQLRFGGSHKVLKQNIKNDDNGRRNACQRVRSLIIILSSCLQVPSLQLWVKLHLKKQVAKEALSDSLNHVTMHSSYTLWKTNVLRDTEFWVVISLSSKCNLKCSNCNFDSRQVVQIHDLCTKPQNLCSYTFLVKFLEELYTSLCTCTLKLKSKKRNKRDEREKTKTKNILDEKNKNFTN